jgi:phosphoglycolate phosphatase
MCTLLVLWDIDHTLIENHGVNKKIYALAFELLTGRYAEHPAQTDGRTEPEIMRNMLITHGIEPNSDHVARMPAALESATVTMSYLLRDRGHELPGARNALATLQASPGIIQSVLSGNIKADAVIKLSTFGFEGFIDFEVGGYGSDDEIRANLVSVAQKRAMVKYGAKFDAANTILIGDTPRDVQAGRIGGAHVIGIASGSHSADALIAEGADVVLADLQNTEAVVRAIAAYRSLGASLRDGRAYSWCSLSPEVWMLDWRRDLPHALETLNIHVKEISRAHSPQVKYGSHVTVHTIDMLIHEHLVIVNEYRIVERFFLEQEFNTGHAR